MNPTISITAQALTSPPAALSGEALLRVGPWEGLYLAGQGSLSRVYRARPIANGDSTGTKGNEQAMRPASYALKLLDQRWEGDEAAIEVFAREALVGRKVSHPHLISVLASHVGQSPYYVVTPWLEGTTLARRIVKNRPSLPEALWIVRQVAEALAALDEGGWMHADIKPTNIFVSPEGHATLLDLGFARRVHEGGSVVDRAVVGTAYYIAPEMITSTLRADIRSDIYSLGITLFELLGGRRPFHNGSLAELARQHRQDRPIDLQLLCPELPESVAALVRQMMAKEPLRRPQSPAELVERLLELEIATFSERQALAQAG